MTNEAKKEPLLPVYLITGSDELKREAVIKRLRARIAELGDISFNSDTFEGEQAQGSDIVAACNTIPFASNIRLVQVNDVDKLKKADAELLVNYVSSPAETTVLALLTSGLAKNTRLYKAVAAVGKKAVIECTPQKKYELPKTVKAMAVSHGVTFSDAAAHALVDLVGENTVRLDSEIRKIALSHRGSDAVSEHEIIALVGRTAAVKPWEFVDAFSSRNKRKCMEYWNKMDSVSPYGLLAMCVTRIRELICTRSLIARGEEAAIASALKVPSWRIKNHRTWAMNFTPEELRRAIITSRDIEKKMKSSSDADTLLLEWILKVL